MIKPDLHPLLKLLGFYYTYETLTVFKLSSIVKKKPEIIHLKSLCLWFDWLVIKTEELDSGQNKTITTDD